MVLGRGYSFITLFGHRKQSHKARAASQSSYPPFDIYSPLCPASVVAEVHRLQDTFSSRAWARAGRSEIHEEAAPPGERSRGPSPKSCGRNGDSGKLKRQHPQD